jgi:hypothetical protein
MRVLRDVVIDRVDQHELLAVSQAPAIAGEEMTLDLVGAGASIELRVRVLESRPVIVDGAVRHRVRLCVVRTASGMDLTESPVVSVGADTAAEAI